MVSINLPSCLGGTRPELAVHSTLSGIAILSAFLTSPKPVLPFTGEGCLADVIVEDHAKHLPQYFPFGSLAGGWMF